MASLTLRSLHPTAGSQSGSSRSTRSRPRLSFSVPLLFHKVMLGCFPEPTLRTHRDLSWPPAGLRSPASPGKPREWQWCPRHPHCRHALSPHAPYSEATSRTFSHSLPSSWSFPGGGAQLRPSNLHPGTRPPIARPYPFQSILLTGLNLAKRLPCCLPN